MCEILVIKYYIHILLISLQIFWTCAMTDDSLSTDVWKFVAYHEKLGRYVWISKREMEREEAGEECRKMHKEMTNRQHNELSDPYSFFPNTLLDEIEVQEMFDFYKNLNFKHDIWAGRALDPKSSGCSSEKRNCCVLLKWDQRKAMHTFTEPQPFSCAERHTAACAYEPTEKVDWNEFSLRK